MKNKPSKRRDHVEQGMTAYDGAAATVVNTTDFDYDAIDANNGWKEPGAKPKRASKSLKTEALFAIIDYVLEPYEHKAKLRGKLKNIAMRPMTSAYAKLVLIKHAIKPSCLGFQNPSLQVIADVVGISKQSLGRLNVDFSNRFPLFHNRAMKSPAIRQLYRESQLAKQEPLPPDNNSHPQLRLF